MVDLFL
jgi:hypothetical protein